MFGGNSGHCYFDAVISKTRSKGRLWALGLVMGKSFLIGERPF